MHKITILITIFFFMNISIIAQEKKSGETSASNKNKNEKILYKKKYNAEIKDLHKRLTKMIKLYVKTYPKKKDNLSFRISHGKIKRPNSKEVLMVEEDAKVVFEGNEITKLTFDLTRYAAREVDSQRRTIVNDNLKAKNLNHIELTYLLVNEENSRTLKQLPGAKIQNSLLKRYRQNLKHLMRAVRERLKFNIETERAKFSSIVNWTGLSKD